MKLNISFDPAGWELAAKNWTAWWQGELERPLVMIESRVDINKPHLGFPDLATRFHWDTPLEEILHEYAGWFENTRWHGDAFPSFYPNFGPGLVAAFLGADLKADANTVWIESRVKKPIEECSFKFENQNKWWRRVAQFTQTLVDEWGDQLCVGYTDLGGNLDILASLLGSNELIFALSDNPDEVLRLVRQISEIWRRYFYELENIISRKSRGRTPWAAIWAPGTCYMLQSDFSYMISPRMFKKFVLPDLEYQVEHIDFPFYHLDGKGELPHLPHLLGIKKLRGIQWIPGDGQPAPEDWLNVLNQIRSAGKLCQVYVTAEGAIKICRELGGKGFAFYIMPPMKTEDAEGFLEEIGHYS
jgi:5-methyltetrahydrofolate--homocysteine methyltransferase